MQTGKSLGEFKAVAVKEASNVPTVAPVPDVALTPISNGKLILLDIEIKEALTCPLSGMIFKDPVTLPSGHVVERDRARELKENPFVVPNQPFVYDEKTLATNFTIKSIVAEFLARNPGNQKHQYKKQIEGSIEDKADSKGTLSATDPKQNEETDLEKLKASITCPVSFAIFANPVTAESGHVFEKDALEACPKDQNGKIKHPLIRDCRIELEKCSTNLVIKRIVTNVLKYYPEFKEEQHKEKEIKQQEGVANIPPAPPVPLTSCQMVTIGCGSTLMILGVLGAGAGCATMFCALGTCKCCVAPTPIMGTIAASSCGAGISAVAVGAGIYASHKYCGPSQLAEQGRPAAPVMRR